MLPKHPRPARPAARPLWLVGRLALTGALVLMFQDASAWAQGWPDLSRPAPSVGGGERDAGVVVGIEGYGFVPSVPGAEANAKAWYDFLTLTRGGNPAAVKLLLGEDATREEILEAAQSAAARADPRGTLWFVFIGHGAPSADGQDGLLVGVDAQQKAASLQKRSLKRSELLSSLANSRAGSISVILDACFSGRGQDGASIAPGLQPLVTIAAAGAPDSRMVILTAAKGNQFAGALPGANRPAFSYLTLGALRGWTAGKDGRVTAGAVWRYATQALEATLRGRNQTPDIMGSEEAAVAATSAGEKAPDLAALAKATAGRGGLDFSVSNLPAVPRAKAPKALDSAAPGLDLGSVDVDALEKYDAASGFDTGEASPEEKAASWRTLSKEAPQFADLAEKRATEWDRYAAEWKAGEEARQRRAQARDADWGKLSRLLALKVIAAKDKERWSGQFVGAYLESPGIGPAAAAELVKFTPEGPARQALAKLAESAPPETAESSAERGPLLSQDDQALLTRLEGTFLSDFQKYPQYLDLAGIYGEMYPEGCAGDGRLWALENFRMRIGSFLFTNASPTEALGAIMRNPAYLFSVFAARDRFRLSAEELKSRGVGVVVEELIRYHDKIIRTKDWEAKFKEISGLGGLKNGRVFHERGFPAPSERCFSLSGGGEASWDAGIDAWLYSFWMRRHGEGTMGATVKLLRWAQKALGG